MRLFILMVSILVSKIGFALPTESAGMITHTKITRVIGGLLFVLILIMVLSWLVKRLHGVHLSSAKGFQSIATMALGPKERVVLMKVGDKYLLMGVGGGAINMLYDFGNELPSGFDLESKPSFADLLKSAVGKS